MINEHLIIYTVVAIVAFIAIIIMFYRINLSNPDSVSFVHSLFARQQAKQSASIVIKAGFGGLLAISIIGLLSYLTNSPLLMAPFGATCVLLFSIPQSPLSQPANVIGGHLVSTLVGLGLHMLLPTHWWSLGLAVGLAIAAMAILRITHPPAGADPLVVFFDDPGWDYIGLPVAAGSVALVIIAWLFHLLPPRISYPAPISVSNSKKHRPVNV